MSTNRFQVIEGGRVPAEVKRSIHAQLFELGHGPREVARRNGRGEREAVQLALEVEREAAARRTAAAVRAARLSFLGRAA
jgi:hypothetical protein